MRKPLNNRARGFLGAAIIMATLVPGAQASANTEPAPANVAYSANLANNTIFTAKVTRPFHPTARLASKTVNGTARIMATANADDSIRVTSTKPTVITLDIVKTANKGQIQKDRRTVKVGPKGVVVDGLASGRTYLIKTKEGKTARITPMKRVHAVGAINARFADTPTRANVDAQHVREWARGNTNVQYWWKVSRYVPDNAKVTARELLVNEDRSVGSTTTETPSSTVPLPSKGYVQLDVVAINALGLAEVTTLYTQTTVEQAWAAQGSGGSLLLASTPPVSTPEVVEGMTPLEKVELHEDRSDTSASNARQAADAAKRAAGAAKAAMEAGNPEGVTSQADIAHEQAAKARAAAIEAELHKNQIPGDTFREQRLAAEENAKAAAKSADEAEYAAAQASWFAAEAWRAESIRALNELENGHDTFLDFEAMFFGERLSSRSAYADYMASMELSRINPAKYPEFSADATADMAEAREAAGAAEAVEQMVKARENGIDTAINALTPSQAITYASLARQAAVEARAAADAVVAANSFPGTYFDDIALGAAVKAEAFADEAELARDDVIHRDAAQKNQAQAESFLADAAATTTAAAARPILEEARDAATRAETEAAAVRAASDEKAAAVAAAVAARAAADAAEQHAMASQSLLDEAINIDASSLNVPGGTSNGSFTFTKNPNDTRGSIDYIVTASRDGNKVTWTQVDNGDGTITVSGAVPAGSNAVVFKVQPTSYNERFSNSPSTFSQAAPSVAELLALTSMAEASSVEVCGETPGAPGAMEGAECVGTGPLKYDTATLVYSTTPYTYTSTPYSHTESYQEWDAGGAGIFTAPPDGNCAQYGASLQSGNGHWNCIKGGYVTRTRTVSGTTVTKNGIPAGYTDNGSVWVSNTPNPTPGRTAVIDSYFSDNGWSITGGQYVAVSPLPASNLDKGTGVSAIAYKYEAGKNTYVTRNAPAIAKTFRPVLANLPNGVTGWGDSIALNTDLKGDDTGRFSPVITFKTVGGDVTVTAPYVNGVAADQ